MKLAFILWLASVLPQPVADPLCLTTTIYLEARDQPVAGQRAVAEVALRRADSGLWGNSVCARSEEHTSELQSLMRISYAVFCLKKKNNSNKTRKSRRATRHNRYIE